MQDFTFSHFEKKGNSYTATLKINTDQKYQANQMLNIIGYKGHNKKKHKIFDIYLTIINNNSQNNYKVHIIKFSSQILNQALSKQKLIKIKYPITGKLIEIDTIDANKSIPCDSVTTGKVQQTYREPIIPPSLLTRMQSVAPIQ